MAAPGGTASGGGWAARSGPSRYLAGGLIIHAPGGLGHRFLDGRPDRYPNDLQIGPGAETVTAAADAVTVSVTVSGDRAASACSTAPARACCSAGVPA
jgi:hypothetical protein